jgi:hypothetical protein
MPQWLSQLLIRTVGRGEPGQQLNVTLIGIGHNLLAHTIMINGQPRRQQLTF